MDPMTPLWEHSNRFDRRALPLADRHYNRQKPGSPQFVPPGRCLVLLTADRSALWVTSWPFEQYTRHRWAGAWVNSLFRNEGAHRASDLIREAIAATRWFYGDPPPLGIVTFVDPRHVRVARRRGSNLYGYCYLKAGFEHVGFTEDAGLWCWQMTPDRMPPPAPPSSAQLRLVM
jgi:hypothetical protein